MIQHLVGKGKTSKDTKNRVICLELVAKGSMFMSSIMARFGVVVGGLLKKPRHVSLPKAIGMMAIIIIGPSTVTDED